VGAYTASTSLNLDDVKISVNLYTVKIDATKIEAEAAMTDAVEHSGFASAGKVLVTGISGFLAGHVALTLLARGYSVRGSVRSIAIATQVRAWLVEAGADIDRVEFCVLDLLKDQGWHEAASGCRYLQHIASPFVLTMPKNEDDLIRPALEGTRRAINAALETGHERLVVTSSVAAIDGGHADYSRSLGTADWSNLDGPHITAYTKSKTLAEKAAWSLADRASARERLAVINPGTLLGPLLSSDAGTSAGVIQRMLKGEMPMVPDLILPYVDVRDVAEAHVAAMTSSAASGNRHIVTNAALPLMDIGEILRTRLPGQSAKVPKRRMPAWMATLFALFDASLRDGKTYLGVRRRYDTSSGAALLGRPLRPTAGAVEATARSLLERRLVS
jgi:nucleoside-diphosphate-sugar epimerase